MSECLTAALLGSDSSPAVIPGVRRQRGQNQRTQKERGWGEVPHLFPRSGEPWEGVSVAED